MTFSQFNPVLGTLTAIDLIAQSSTLQGNATVARVSGTKNISDMIALLIIDSASGFDGYFGDPLEYNRSPSGTITVNATNTSQLVTVTGTTQSLIGGSPVTFNLNPSSFASYTGLGVMLFSSAIFAGDNQSGIGAASINYSNLLSPTTLTLRYTYTPSGPVPIPEPGQVAASLLLLSGIGAYIFLKRRKKSATTVA